MSTFAQTSEFARAPQSISVPPALIYTKVAIVVVAILCAAVQLVWHEPGDVFVLAALLGTAMSFYALRLSSLTSMPMSCLVLIGCGMSNFFLPLVMTTIESKPLTFELQRPDLTFGFNLLAFATLIACHAVYSSSHSLWKAREAISLRVLSPLGLFVVPTPGQLIGVGAVGLGSMFAVSLVFGTRPEENFGNAFFKTLEALSSLAYAPYLILLYPLMGQPAIRLRSAVWPMALFTMGLVVAGSARNSRTALLLGFVGIALGIALGAWIGLFPARTFRLSKVLMVLFGLALLFPVAQRLASAMVVVRAEHFYDRPLQALSSTFSAVLSPDSSAAFRFREDESTANKRWHGGDELYVDNLFFARLCNLKFADNTLSIVAELDSAGRGEIANREATIALSILPQPVLSALGVDIDKQTSRGSMGSFIYSLVLGSPEVAGYFATGSYLASAWASFGFLFPLAVGGIAIALFLAADSFTLPLRQSSRLFFSPVSLLWLYPAAVLFTSAALAPESLAGLLESLLRELPQLAVLYAAVFWFVRRLRLG